MILPDVNVLLHAVNSGASQHAVAHAALREAYVQGPVLMCWPALLGFLRLSTRTGILSRPLAVEQALGVVRSWLEHPSTVQLHPTAQHAAVLGALLIGAGQGGPLVSDAHLAALAIEHQATILTFDRDFARFPGLRFRHLI
jgi:toxin-antitoxin system PIN domain toxin